MRERCARWEREREIDRDRERERERERERRKWRHHCRAKIGDEFTLPLAKNSHSCDPFTLSLAKNSPFSFLPSHLPSCRAKIGDEFTLSLAKNLHNCVEFKLSLASLLLLWPIVAQCSCSMKHWKNQSNYYQELLEIEKEIVREDARVLKNWRKIICWAQIITRQSRYGFWWFVLNKWFFFNFLTLAHPHAQSLFLYPIVFGIIHIGLRVEAWSANFCLFRGEGGVFK